MLGESGVNLGGHIQGGGNQGKKCGFFPEEGPTQGKGGGDRQRKTIKKKGKNQLVGQESFYQDGWGLSVK